MNLDPFQIFQQGQIRITAGGQAPYFLLQTRIGCRIESHRLNRLHRGQAEIDSPTDDKVNMSMFSRIIRGHPIGHED